MKYTISFLFVAFCFSLSLTAQVPKKVISGPWAGNIELRNATIWVEVSAAVKTVVVKYFPVKDVKKTNTVVYKGALGNDFNPLKMELNGLDFNTTYQYTLIVDGQQWTPGNATTFITKDLWQHRKPAPDFSFLAGSCAYFNEPIFDRPGKPYGGDSSIFETMAKTKANFHIWMGDNWYTREVDYSTAWGLNYRASRDHSHKVLQPLLAAMPQYAIWDDHDFGPDNSGTGFILKAESRRVFKNYTLNPSYGEDGKGIYTRFSYSDVDFFLTDDRYFRSDPQMADSVNGQLYPQKTFFGRQQMDWLKNELLNSKATFKIIVVGSQVLNPLNRGECMQAYISEHTELLNFLSVHKLPGVLFFTGDQHHSEVIRMDRPGLPPLYDVTISPYTAGVSKARGENEKNPYRVSNSLVEAQNFGKISVTGAQNERILRVDFNGIKGELLATWSVSEKELKQAR